MFIESYNYFIKFLKKLKGSREKAHQLRSLSALSEDWVQSCHSQEIKQHLLVSTGICTDTQIKLSHVLIFTFMCIDIFPTWCRSVPPVPDTYWDQFLEMTLIVSLHLTLDIFKHWHPSSSPKVSKITYSKLTFLTTWNKSSFVVRMLILFWVVYFRMILVNYEYWLLKTLIQVVFKLCLMRHMSNRCCLISINQNAKSPSQDLLQSWKFGDLLRVRNKHGCFQLFSN